MLKDLLNRLLELRRPETIAVNGIEGISFDQKGNIFTPPRANSVLLNSLDGFIDFVKYHTITDRHFVQVVDENNVSFYSDLIEPWKIRHKLAQAQTIHEEYPFEKWRPVGLFVIELMAHFVQTDASRKIMKLVSNIKTVDEKGVQDDGHKQSVTAKTGITDVENVDVPNPVKLRPVRTFLEVEQPESEYILRLRDREGVGGFGNVEAGLFTAAGGQWKIHAMENIRKYLKSHLDGMSNIFVL